MTPEVFSHLSQEIPKLTPHEIYEGFYVSSRPTGNEWDIILKVFWKNDKENKTYIKFSSNQFAEYKFV